MVRILLLLLALLASAPALAKDAPLVLAAASLQEALTDAADAWARQGHARPVLSFAASSALARQIEAGGRADLFISADESWMDAIAAKGLIRAGTRASFLANRLVLIAPVGQGRSQERARLLAIDRRLPLVRMLGGGRLAMADPEAVPAGKYGQAALTALGLWPTVAAKIAPAENVRAALALVERGAAPYGIVYATDARASKAVRVVGVFPASSHPLITYPVAILKASANSDAEGFRRFLISRQGKAIFVRRGFSAQ